MADPTPSVNTRTCAPCPTCRAPYGFHDDGPHAEAAARIPAELRLPPNSIAREERGRAKHEAYLAWLASQETTTESEAADVA